ncbi:cupin domain-containing protein [Glutamicibacter sp. MNS18]|uniref:cupin domain-containing protein n=1 Tax=Glutamicibacter sp. MNS18 TaxID=2989817 RepID=UPI00223645B3|nr:cupin domain-containing protein [Glutamicibacter sp. MNS18]MCW4467218.1 cupin domain-containing protein [Glutamicibacter sp. MNS18]
MNAKTTERVHLVRKEERQSLWFLGDLVQPLATGQQTRDGLYIAHYQAAPSSQPPLHEHDDDDEIFFITQGRIAFWAEGEEKIIGTAGDFVILPKGVAHTFQASPEEGATWLLILSPSSSFEKVINAVATPAGYEAPEQGWQIDAATVATLERVAPSGGVRLLGAPGDLPASHQQGIQS